MGRLVSSMLLDQPAIEAWAVASVLLALKTLFVMGLIGVARTRTQTFISPEDYAYSGLEPKPIDPDIERIRRVHQNDVEALVLFCTLGFVYALTSPSSAAQWIVFGGFVLARVLHTVCYLRSMAPHRTIVFGLGFALLLWMAGASLYSLLVG